MLNRARHALQQQCMRALIATQSSRAGLDTSAAVASTSGAHMGEASGAVAGAARGLSTTRPALDLREFLDWDYRAGKEAAFGEHTLE